MTIDDAIRTAAEKTPRPSRIYTLYLARKRHGGNIFKIGVTKRIELSQRTREYRPRTEDDDLRGVWCAKGIAWFRHLETAQYAESILRNAAYELGAVPYHRKYDYFRGITRKKLAIAAGKVCQLLPSHRIA